MSDPNQPWAPPPANPYGEQAQPYGQQPAYGSPYLPARDPDKRPGTVLAAGITTIVLAGLSFLLYAVVVLLMIVARDDMVGTLDDSLTADQRDLFGADGLATFLTVVMVAFAVWCLVAVLLAVLAMRRSAVARILLVVSSGLTVLVSLLAISSLVSGVTFIAAIAVIVLLFTGGANDWYARRGTRPPEAPAAQPWG